MDLAELARQREPFEQHVCQVLARYRRHIAAETELTCAAVLLPLLYKEGRWHVLFTQRTQDVEHHKGQISFPGGACEPIDEDLAATALRETDEEIGVPPHLVRVLGALDDFPTITHFVVTPFVGVVPHPLTYRLNRYEVESVVEVPLSFFTDPSGLRIEQREHEGQIFDVLFWDYGPHTIWGATARILKGFLELIA
ncbi:MAG: NUDIX hydrolase [Anaerolineae bacterium]|jgi:8-oxo-dGTP pyrophosphatase MutT (NUDIX family)